MPGALSIFLLLFVIHYYAPTTTANSISYGETANNLTSDGGTFRLGFFERGSNAYLGIWYGAAAASPDEVIVWVANRDNPIPLQRRPRGYFFRISDNGNAEVFDSNNRSYWSTNHSSTPSSAEQMVLQLSDTGNLILVDGGSRGGTLWQSFENPSDTFLPGMDITFPGLALVSWKGPQDAAQGNYSFRRDNESSTLFIYNASATYWDSTYSSLHPNLTSFLLNNTNGISSAWRLVMNYTGSVELWELQEGNGSWSMIWKAPKDQCDVFDTCGTFGVCDAGNRFRCKCLPGYEPNNLGNWESGDFSSGCDQCGQVFLPLPIVKLPPGPNIDKKGSNETVCRDLCLGDCGCRAYSFDANQSRCRHWTDLTRMQEESTHGQTLYIRVYQSEIVHHKHIPLSLEAGVAAASGIVLLLLGSFLFILRLRRRRAIQRAGIIDQFKTDDTEDIEIPFIDYQSILDVTDNFSDSNKLGAGEFGPVYKGKLPDGNEVAVKRLSTASVQGIEEFRNEVILIAKLQHRNLVRVLGYCMKEDEKILIYEYMPNKCLSSFIFDQTTSPLLDWTKRFNIILGIARGLVYLHQDSRLRIIHRDLKPSNILLDEELNPKISDFGLARIVAGNEIATCTARVVGTYGYMSPEYALDGYFSIKSDVYSFGIILLEVISGRKCTSLLEFDNILISLLGYAWTLWDKERALELVDISIVDSCDSFEVKRCINVGLLCVQDPSDRPTMSTVLLMLGGGDTMSLPHPNQPVFVARRPRLETASSLSSNVELSTTLQGR